MHRFALILIALLALSCKSAPVAPVASDPVAGGLVEDGIVSHLGIEYASADRWKLPQLNTAWDTKSEFKEFGPACPQKGQTKMVEACLFLNVFAPDAQITEAPVLIWIHGGGFIMGEGGEGPKTFAKDGVVVVTFNYRLGKLGFYDWVGWTENHPRNFGQADMVAALDWVQANISRFGGDPKNVTLAGHSAGGMGVQLMMVDPRAEGKFSRAWSHAGYGAWPFPKAFNLSTELDAKTDYAGPEVDRSAEALVADLNFFHLPFIETPFLKAQPIDLFFEGSSHDVPYVAGANSYDGAGTLQGAGFTPQRFLNMIDSPDIRLAYADDFAVSDLQAAQRIFGDLRYFRSSVLSANAKNGYLFLYSERQNSPAGATHGQQYSRVFAPGSFPMKEAMLSYIKTGDPGWPGVSDTDRYKMAIFDPDLSETDAIDYRGKMTALAEAAKALE